MVLQWGYKTALEPNSMLSQEDGVLIVQTAVELIEQAAVVE